MTLVLRSLAIAPTPGGKALFEDLNLRCPPGSMTALVGPNGSGKTTLLRGMAGLGPIRHGEVLLENKPIGAWPARLHAQRCAFMAQRLEVPDELTVYDIVELGRLPHRPRLSALTATDRQAIARALTLTQLEALADRTLATLSGGEIQRVMLARMLATDATYLFLDEPTTAMDIGHSLDLLLLLRELAAAGKTIVVSLHDLALARRFADFTLCLGLQRPPHWVAGPSREIMVPAVLASLFAVDVEVHGDDLRFEPQRRPADHLRTHAVTRPRMP